MLQGTKDWKTFNDCWSEIFFTRQMPFLMTFQQCESIWEKIKPQGSSPANQRQRRSSPANQRQRCIHTATTHQCRSVWNINIVIVTVTNNEKASINNYWIVYLAWVVFWVVSLPLRSQLFTTSGITSAFTVSSGSTLAERDRLWKRLLRFGGGVFDFCLHSQQ